MNPNESKYDPNFLAQRMRTLGEAAEKANRDAMDVLSLFEKAYPDYFRTPTPIEAFNADPDWEDTGYSGEG